MAEGKKNELSDTLKSCPFCGVVPEEHPDPMWKNMYYVIKHKKYCYLYDDTTFELLPKNMMVRLWNERAGETENEEAAHE